MDLNANKTIEAYCKIWEQLNANSLYSLLRRDIKLDYPDVAVLDTPEEVVGYHKMVFEMLKEIPLPGIIVKSKQKGQPGWLEDPRYIVDAYTSNNELIQSHELITIDNDIRKIIIKENHFRGIKNQYTNNDLYTSKND